MKTRTYNTRSSAHAQTVGASPVHYAARSNSKMQSRSPVQNNQSIKKLIRGQIMMLGSERRTRKKRDPTRDWNPAMVSFVFQYSPPTNRPSNADTTICARKNVLSLNSNQSARQTDNQAITGTRLSERKKTFNTNRRSTFHSLPESTSSCVKNAAALVGLDSFFKAPPRSFTVESMTTALDSLSKLGLSCCCCGNGSAGGGMCARSSR